LDSNTGALLVSKDRQHLFVTHCIEGGGGGGDQETTSQEYRRKLTGT
jgi:hypothetical protein